MSVPDDRFKWLCGHFKPKSEVAATLSIFDIAGLVPGAHRGEGLGNAFLSHIQAVDGIFHVVRAFADEEVIHSEGEVDPVKDLSTIASELRLKDMERAQRLLEDLQKSSRQQKAADKTKKAQEEVLQSVLKLLEDGSWVVQGPIIPYSAVFESKLAELPDDAAREKYIKDSGASKSMLDKIIQTGYQALHLLHFFTCGEDEVKCWTIRAGTKAPQAAGVIHTDFERGFICAEVYKYADLVELGSENAVKAAGKYLQKGKDYVVEDGDIIFFKFNVTNSPKK
ncbi:hypothetical protein Emed_004797 [Eimeria media]